MRSSEYFRITALFLTLCYFFSACQEDSPVEPPQPYNYEVPEQTNDGWLTASVYDLNVDPAPLSKAVDYINYGIYKNVHSLLIIKNGMLCFEKYWSGYKFNYSGNNHLGAYTEFDRNTIHNQASVTKSFASTLVGIAIDKGFINSVDDKVFDYFPEYSDLLTPEKAGMTIEHLLSMTSGFEWNEWEFPYGDSKNDLIRMWNVSDPLRYLMAKPIDSSPGSEFYYNSGCTNILGEIVYKASNLKPDKFADQYLFGPLGIIRSTWEKFYNGVVFVSGDLRICPRDMAKLGQLFLDKGKWHDNRIVSEFWTQKATEEYISFTQSTLAYGYQWWLEDLRVNGENIHTFSARGWGGQRIMVFPALNAIVIMTGGNYTEYEPVHEILVEHILPALL